MEGVLHVIEFVQHVTHGMQFMLCGSRFRKLDFLDLSQAFDSVCQIFVQMFSSLTLWKTKAILRFPPQPYFFRHTSFVLQHVDLLTAASSWFNIVFFTAWLLWYKAWICFLWMTCPLLFLSITSLFFNFVFVVSFIYRKLSM